ncbi:prevent-host-death family protein [Bradyrhizobium erythrophlei]|jgi:prevent-host-death family protein|uniref:Antitoxin n=2 Tax=Bradyrhizobium erythrophlei TaxID=1437360 RepID=A0A1M5MIS2_9BRAD|nr:prevent-host-death family protein [Bradyrhizobium erythrophlei]
MMKHVAITEAKTQLNELVAEIESTGDDVVLTRDGVPVARLIRENKQSLSEELMPEQIEQRRKVVARLQQIAGELNVGATQDEIKGWINEGRH